MPKLSIPKEIADLKDLGSKAMAIAKELKDLADAQEDATAAHRKAVEALVKAMDHEATRLDEAAREQAEARIVELKELVDNLEAAVATPGLTPASLEKIQAMINTSRAELINLEFERATDFADILTNAEAAKIRKALADAKKDIQSKKTASAMMTVSMQIADAALFLTGKFAKLALI